MIDASEKSGRFGFQGRSNSALDFSSEGGQRRCRCPHRAVGGSRHFEGQASAKSPQAATSNVVDLALSGGGVHRVVGWVAHGVGSDVRVTCVVVIGGSDAA